MRKFMKKFNNKSNIVGPLLKKKRIANHLSKEDICRKLELYGIYINRIELYRMETEQMIIKDFELIALCEVLDINQSELQNLLSIQ